MAKYSLHYSQLNKAEFKELGFTSAKKRAQFIADAVIGVKPRRVFTLVVKYHSAESGLSDVYVFDSWNCIDLVVNQNWQDFYLMEWVSYEEAYKYCLDLKEEHELCYTKEFNPQDN